MLTKKHSALFFDFDGVLVDSTYIKMSAFKEMFASYGESVVSQLIAHHKRHGGISRVDKIKFAHEHFIGKPLSEQELEKWAEDYSQRVVEKVVAAEWVAGAMEFLDEMHTQVPIFVISGTPEDELKQVIQRRNMTGYFREILGSPTRKPAHIRNLISQYRLQAEYCIFIGDALTDYNAARETGLHFIGIQGEIDFPANTVVLPDCTSLKTVISQLH